MQHFIKYELNPHWNRLSQSRIVCCGRFGRCASLYHHRSQLFGRLWVRLPLPTAQFSEILFSAYNVRHGSLIIELVLDPTTWVHFLLVPLDLIV